MAGFALLAGLGAAWVFAATIAAGAAGISAGKDASLPRPVAVLDISGIIDPVLVRYVQRAYLEAQQINAQCVILKISTPGGLEQSMREIVQETLNAPLPTIAYVTPRGARAASAGAFIVLSCHLTSMAPGTTMGAAHPVSGKGQDIPKTLDEKITNDAAAFMRSLARQRGRDVKWAEEAVTKSLSINEEEAREKGLVDVVAEDMDDLIEKLDGRTVKIRETTFTLRLKGASRIPIELSFREKFFHMLAHPELAYILLSLGTLGLIYEIQSPGIGLAGFFGGICLILALISLSVLPFSVGGLLMMALGVGLFFADIKLGTHGALSVLGVACLLLGSLMLFAPLEPFWRLSRGVIYTMVVIMSTFFGIMVYLGIRSQFSPSATGAGTLIGARGTVVITLNPEGIIHVQGEEWSARPVPGVSKIRKDTDVVIRSRNGLVLVVEPVETGNAVAGLPRPLDEDSPPAGSRKGRRRQA